MVDSQKNVNEAFKKHKKSHFGKKWLIVIFLITFVAFAGALYGFGIIDSFFKKIDPISIEAVDKKIKDGDKKAANNIAKELLKKSDTIDNRRALILTQQLAEDYTAVISTYEPILDNKKLDYQDYQNIANAYYHTDNKAEAAKYYRLAADNWPSNDPAHDPEKAYLYRLADFLEGKVTDA